jgi:hypothetical protein
MRSIHPMKSVPKGHVVFIPWHVPSPLAGQHAIVRDAIGSVLQCESRFGATVEVECSQVELLGYLVQPNAHPFGWYD